MKYIAVFIIFFFLISCSKPKKDLTVDVKMVSSNVTKENNQDMLIYRPNSIGYKVKVTVKNDTKNDVGFWTMSCSFYQDFTSNHPEILLVSMLPVRCDSNYPMSYLLRPNEHTDFEFFVFKDHNISDTKINEEISKTKIGLIVRAETNDFRKNRDEYSANVDSKKYVKII